MSVKVISWVWDHSHSAGNDRLVLLAIADSADHDGGNSWPSTATLARKTGLDQRTVQRITRRLVELGELSIEENAGRRGTNVYTVVMTPGGTPPRQDAAPGMVTPHPRQDAAPTPGRMPPEPSLEPSLPVQLPTTLSEAANATPGRELALDRPDVERVCQHLADAITANGCKPPTVGKGWQDAARLLLDRDGRSEQQVHAAIDWATKDEFWRSNILSMPTLRKQYDRLRLAAQRAAPNGRASTTDQRVQDALDLADRLERRALP